jgi:hypothetical protein
MARCRVVCACAVLWLCVVACASDPGASDPACDAEPVEATIVLYPDINETSYVCSEGYFRHFDRSCGPPTAPGCATLGDGRCYKECNAHDDCCGLECTPVPIFDGNDFGIAVNLCDGQPP